MFAVNHAATALLLKRRFPQAPLGWLLVSVQGMELLWVALHFVGIERTHTEPVVRSVRPPSLTRRRGRLKENQ